MSNKFNIKKLTLLLFILSTIGSYAQSKKERKAEITSLESGMYNSSESKEALKFYDEAADFGQSKEYKKAIKLYKKALKEDPNFIEAYDNMALCYRKLGDFKNAIANYNKSIELYPKGTMAHMNLGVIYGIQKEYDKALAEYEIMQNLEPDNPEGYYGTINIYLVKGNFKSAIKNATKTLEIYEAINSPYTVEAQYLLGLSYFYNNDNANAKTYIELAKKNGMKVPEKLGQKLGIE